MLVVFEADCTAIVGLCASSEAAYARRGLALSPLICVAYAALCALPRHPALRLRWGDAGLILPRRLHLLVSGMGLVCDAGDLTLRGLSRALGRRAALEPAPASFAIVALAGAGWAGPPLLAGLGATLGVGAPTPTAVALGEQLAIRPLARLALSFDPRCIDMAAAAAFLHDLRASVEAFRSLEGVL
jgi:2-oxoisovalerate dehydrogenase E2 component (dihydrolipoyl transacylase)